MTLPTYLSGERIQGRTDDSLASAEVVYTTQCFDDNDDTLDSDQITTRSGNTRLWGGVKVVSSGALNGKYCKKIRVKLHVNGATTGDLVGQIRSGCTSGSPGSQGTLRLTSTNTIDLATLQDSTTFIEFTFDGSYAFGTNSDECVLIYWASAESNGSNDIWIAMRWSNETANTADVISTTNDGAPNQVDFEFWTSKNTNMSITYDEGATPKDKSSLVTGTALVGMASAANGSISGATHSTTSPPVGVGWLDFDGSNDHFTADGAADACTTIGTVSVWFHTDGYSSGDGDRLFEFGDGSGEFLASINSTGKVAFIMQHGSTMQWNGSTDGSSITNDTWYHLVITQNGTSPKFWLGALGSAITDQTNLSTTTDVTKWFEVSWNSFEIGVNQAHSGGRLDGGIAEFACWNTVLTDSQISDLHNASGNGVSASTISTGLRFLFNFDVNGEADNKALTGTTYTSDLPTGTRYEETDTRKIYRLTSSSGWKEKGVA